MSSCTMLEGSELNQTLLVNLLELSTAAFYTETDINIADVSPATGAF